MKRKAQTFTSPRYSESLIMTNKDAKANVKLTKLNVNLVWRERDSDSRLRVMSPVCFLYTIPL